MDREEIKTKIKNIIISISESEINFEDIDEGENGIAKIGLNSLGLIRLSVEIEKEFNIEMDMDDEEIEIFLSVSKLANYIQKKISE